jgi:hypothetical protein
MRMADVGTEALASKQAGVGVKARACLSSLIPRAIGWSPPGGRALLHGIERSHGVPGPDLAGVGQRFQERLIGLAWIVIRGRLAPIDKPENVKGCECC